jgi:Flp pilus assembly protein CpaB
LKRSNRLMLVLGVVLALAAFGAVLMFGSGGNSQPAAPTTASVATTTVAVPLGTALDSTMLTMTDVPVAQAVNAYDNTDILVGRVVRTNLAANAVVTPEAFQAAGTTSAVDLTQALKPGQVAVAVDVDALTGVGGLISDGDYVDVVLATAIPIVIDTPKGASGSNGAPFTSIGDVANNTSVKVLVQNVQVIGHAMAATSDTNGSAAVDPNTGQPVSGDQVLILSVTPQQAEEIRFGQTDADANLALILRSPGDEQAADVTTTGITLRELVDKYGVLPPQTISVDYP